MENREGSEDDMRTHHHYYWTCPYYRAVKNGRMYCEGGSIAMPDDAADEYFRTYCNDLNGWRRCTVARAVTRHYEARAAEEEEKIF